MSVISGTAYWASLQSPNTKFEPSWQIEVCNLDAENKAIAEKDNLTIKYDDVKGDYVSIKRKVKRKDGNNNQPPIVVDAQKRPMLDLIANGSKVNVLYEPFEWNFGGKTGVSADLRAVQVTELVPYSTEEDDAFDVVPDGFTSDEAEDIPFSA